MIFMRETNGPFLIMSNVKYFLLIFPLLVFTGEGFATCPTMVVLVKVKLIVDDLASTEI